MLLAGDYIAPNTGLGWQFLYQACELHVTFKSPYMYEYITKLCSIQAEVILKHTNPNVHGIRQREVRYRKYKVLKLGGGQAWNHTAD
jgi:hypothetical protein